MSRPIANPQSAVSLGPPFPQLAGPGLVVAATGIGSGDVVSATVGEGARYGVVLLWALPRRVLRVRAERGYRAVATGHWSDRGGGLGRLPRVGEGLLRLPLVLWTVAVSAALTNAWAWASPTSPAASCLNPGAVAHGLIGSGCSSGWGVRALREADEGARRGHGLQHPDLRQPHDDQPRTGPAGLFVPTIPADGEALRVVAHRRHRRIDRCCPTTTGCARKRCTARNI